MTITGERLTTGRKLAEDTARWMEHNEHSFYALHRYLLQMRSNGIKGRVRDRMAAFCVDKSISVGNDPYAFDNNLWAGISRYMVLFDRSLVGSPIEFRDSAIDCYGMLPVSFLPNLPTGDVIHD